MIYQRIMRMDLLLQKKSFFLFGPRSTGKTTLIKQQLSNYSANVIFYDLLDLATYTDLLRRPKLLEEKLNTKAANESIIVIDEIQKFPKILDEVHRLIEKYKIRFLLTGSSARKLKRGAANLLGGRAWEAHLYGLIFKEITDFDLIKYLNRGGLPHIYLSEDYKEELNNYINLYIREEIVQEALVRKLDYFIRFLDIMGLQNGEELHFQSISSDAGVPAKTVQNYIQILEDTLIGFQLYPYLHTKKRKAITRSKFYFFDIGIVNVLAKRSEILNVSELFGKAFEHFLILEIKSYLSYRRKNLVTTYWRSTSQFEVDCIIGDNLACEIKSTTFVTEKHLKGLKALREEQKIQKFCIISQDTQMRVIENIQVYPWRTFLELLWDEQIV